ncbi:MAG TPA: two component system response regulator [Trinickia sp.]|jgi:two-component system secretion response regulator SsrB|nr:two component system response regulator [Trinickia sp.]
MYSATAFFEREVPTTHRILIVDDHSLLRDGIKQALAGEPSYRVVGEAADGLEVYSVCHALQPDVVLLDLGLPGMYGIEVISQLKRRWPALVIMVLTADAAEFRAREALDAGASGYVLKAGAKETLLTALAITVRGERFLDPALDRTLIGTASDSSERAVLTGRERQILQLVAEGARNRDIAEKLSISIKTVETHRLNLMRKLNAHKAVELANWAHRLGLVVSSPAKGWTVPV